MHSEISHRRFAGRLLLILLLGLLPASASAAPRLLSMSPADGEITNAESITLEGVAEGATRVVVDGQSVALDPDGSFRAGPYRLQEGESRFLIVLEDAEGSEKARVHRVVADRRAPVPALDP